MVNDCLIHSVSIYDSDDNLVEVLYASNTIFSIECSKKGYKYKMNGGKILDTSLYEFTHHKHSNLRENIHYNAKPISIPAPVSLGPMAPWPPWWWCVAQGHSCKPHIWQQGDTCESVAKNSNTLPKYIVVWDICGSSIEPKPCNAARTIGIKIPAMVCPNNNENIADEVDLNKCKPIPPVPSPGDDTIGQGYYSTTTTRPYVYSLCSNKKTCYMGQEQWP